MSELRKELKEKAEKLGIEVKEDMDENSLEEAIKVKEEGTKTKKDDSEDADHWKREAEKAFKKRDDAKADSRKLRAKIKDLEDRLENAPNSEDFESMKETLSELKEFKKEKDAEAEEKADKERTELERAQVSFNKEFEAFKTKMKNDMEKVVKESGDKDKEIEKSKAQVKELRRFRLDGEIRDAAKKFKAYSERQIVSIVRDNFTYDESLDKFSHLVKDSKGKITDEKSVEEFVEDFLKDPENDNLVESDVNTSGSHTSSSRNQTSSHKSTKKFGKYDPNDEKLILEADDKGLSIEDLIDIKEKKDAKLAKIKAS